VSGQQMNGHPYNESEMRSPEVGSMLAALAHCVA
jgi:hypothetical protein